MKKSEIIIIITIVILAIAAIVVGIFAFKGTEETSAPKEDKIGNFFSELFEKKPEEEDVDPVEPVTTKEPDESGIVDKDFVYEHISKEGFIVFNNETTEDKCLDIEDFVFRISDDDARKVIQKIAGITSTTELQLFDRDERNKCIKKMKQKGLSIRQISRLTGISFAIVRNI